MTNVIVVEDRGITMDGLDREIPPLVLEDDLEAVLRAHADSACDDEDGLIEVDDIEELDRILPHMMRKLQPVEVLERLERCPIGHKRVERVLKVLTLEEMMVTFQWCRAQEWGSTPMNYAIERFMAENARAQEALTLVMNPEKRKRHRRNRARAH